MDRLKGGGKYSKMLFHSINTTTINAALNWTTWVPWSISCDPTCQDSSSATSSSNSRLLLRQWGNSLSLRWWERAGKIRSNTSFGTNTKKQKYSITQLMSNKCKLLKKLSQQKKKRKRLFKKQIRKNQQRRRNLLTTSQRSSLMCLFTVFVANLLRPLKRC